MLERSLGIKKKKNRTGRLKRSCETAKEKCDTVRRRKKKEKKNHGINERLNIVQFVLDLLLASLTFSRYFSLSFLFPSFHSFVSFFFLTFSHPGYFAAGFRIILSLALSLSLRFLSFPISLVHSLPLSLFSFYFIYFFLCFNFSLSLIPPFIFRIHIFAIRLSRI